MPDLADALDLLDSSAQDQPDLYLLRDRVQGDWAVHFWADGRREVARAPRLADAIREAISIFEGDSDDSWKDLI